MKRKRLHLPSTVLSGSAPLYKQIKRSIIQSLVEGEWKPGEVMPSETRLAHRFGVSISTLRAAIGELVQGKVLVRVQGKGTFVSLHDQHRTLYQFFHIVRNDGQKILPVSELVSVSKTKADHETGDLLRLPRRPRFDEVFRIRNILRISGDPVAVSDISIPAHFFPKLSAATLREGDETLYAVYQGRFGINIVGATEELRAVALDAEAAGIFAVSAGSPALQVSRIAYTFNGTPVEVRRSTVLTRNYHYRFDHGEVNE